MPGEVSFERAFRALTGRTPFPWQGEVYRRLSAGDWKRLTACDIPTGLGKTAVIPIWLIALANRGGVIPRRLVYVVNRRTVVDQATAEAERIRTMLTTPETGTPAPELGEARRQLARSLGALAAKPDSTPLAISTLRGQFADNREWSADPARPAVIVGTVDMIGSRLLFGGYGLGFKTRPLHAGFLGQDALIVHDEAHLEPAFQMLIEAVRNKQENEPAPLGPEKRLKVIALTATPRGGDALQLTDKDRADPEVKKRIEARKSLHIHEYDDDKKLPDRLAELAAAHKEARRTVLVFARTVEAVEKVVERLRKETPHVTPLTGTLRGGERDALVNDPTFQRFLPGAEAGEQTAYLVCTSAGEVGINISADHLVCDLSTFESMAQRFGRVNRFGERRDTRIDVLHPASFNETDELDARRARTLRLLRDLNGDGSPAALGCLDPDNRRVAFSPDPEFLPTSDILFDAWALTSIRGSHPGRPPVEPYLHGRADEHEPPVTHVAWREEVAAINPALRERYKPKDLLEAYPLKPHELLRDRSDRVFRQLAVIAERNPDAWAWLLDDDGAIQPLTLKELADKDRKDRINGRTVLLPPAVGGLEAGFLKGASLSADDVADDWFDERGTKRRERRGGDEPPEGMRLILTIDTAFDSDGEDSEEADPAKRFWRWYVKPRSADDDMSQTACEAVSLDAHTKDVLERTRSIVRSLRLPRDVEAALVRAAELHDLGKRRRLWQKSIGNPDPNVVLAKAGTTKRGWQFRPIDLATDYRHEFGSLLDAYQDDPNLDDLVVHLIAAHHGRGRPHFGADEAFDPEHPHDVAGWVALEVPRQFARLQRRHGRWGLAYLESLLRAADYAASAEPSRTGEE